MDDDALATLGANSSLIHVDWMIGSAQMDVDGIAANGEAEPLMRQGEWA
jgi:aminopeptidase